jgi:hypothetical protein
MSTESSAEQAQPGTVPGCKKYRCTGALVKLARRRMSSDPGTPTTAALRIYECGLCGSWHLGQPGTPDRAGKGRPTGRRSPKRP